MYVREQVHSPGSPPCSTYSFVHPSPITPGNPRSMYCAHSLAFSRTSQSWNHTVQVRSLFRLAALTSSHAVKVASWLLLAPSCWIIRIPCFLSTAVSQGIWSPESVWWVCSVPQGHRRTQRSSISCVCVGIPVHSDAKDSIWEPAVWHVCAFQAASR